MKGISKAFWTLLVIIGIVFVINKYGYIDKKGALNVDHKELSKDWNETCDKASKPIKSWAWDIGKKLDLFVDEQD